VIFKPATWPTCPVDHSVGKDTWDREYWRSQLLSTGQICSVRYFQVRKLEFFLTYRSLKAIGDFSSSMHYSSLFTCLHGDCIIILFFSLLIVKTCFVALWPACKIYQTSSQRYFNSSSGYETTVTHTDTSLCNISVNMCHLYNFAIALA